MLATSLGFPEIDQALASSDGHALVRDGLLIVGTLFGRALLGEWIKEDILPELHKGVKLLMTIVDIEGLLTLIAHKGWKTSEFLSFAVAGLLYLLSNFVDVLQQVHITPETTLPILVASIMYGFQRSLVKRGAAGLIQTAVSSLQTADTTPAPAQTQAQAQTATPAPTTIASDAIAQAPIPPFAPDVVQ